MKNVICHFNPNIYRTLIGRSGIFRVLIMSLLVAGMSFSGQVKSQDKKCAASRTSGQGLFQFSCPGTCKINGVAGNCQRRGQGTWDDGCYCITPTPSQKSCSARETWHINGSPAPFIDYTMVLIPTPTAQAAIWQGADPNPAAFLAPNIGTGTMMVQFGSFAVPDRVPVVITALSRTVPSHPFYGMPTGINQYSLLPGGNDSFFYNSLTGEFSTDDESPVYLLSSNDIRQNEIATLYLSGTLDLGSLECDMRAESYEFIETGGNKQHEETESWANKPVDFSIAPNPASSTAIIRIHAGSRVRTEGQILVYDIKGFLVHRVLVPAEVALVDLDLAPYSTGIYQVVFKDQESFRSKRLVVQQ